MIGSRLLTGQGAPVGLGGELARGGEAAVYDVVGKPDSVAKIYFKDAGSRAEKLPVMIGMATERLRSVAAWPTATLHRPGGALAGFLMPRVDAHRPVFQVYGPKLRLRQFPTADWRFLVHVAANVARAFAMLHAAGLVVGDVNHGNLFVAAKQGTVRFIDVDSMQVSHRGRTWLCEVGVDTHQPPEMQGVASYRGVVRTPNHDAFGLAVLIFQLLCMGRHPFSGRYAGPGDPPDIPQAIAQSRYAYSADTRRTLMSPPPGSLAMAALPGTLTALFDAAFSPTGVKGTRPAAERWADELTGLGRSLVQCGSNAAHWYPRVAGSCPWCEVEGRSGVVLFPAVFVAGRAGAGIVLLWREIEALQDPGPMPVLRRPDASMAQPSALAAAVGRRLRRRKLAAAALLLAGTALVFAVASPADRGWPLLAVALLALGAWWWPRSSDRDRIRDHLTQVRSQWRDLHEAWIAGPAARFPATRQALGELKREHDGLSERRERELRALAANRRQDQLRRHLEAFEIASAKIQGIGKGKVAALLSYGIETAADIEEARVLAVPGFGAKTAANMLAFRRACEAAFRFDGSRAVASSAVAAMEGMLAQRRAKLEAELAAGLAQLKALVQAEQRHRGALAARAAALSPVLAQALADARAVGVAK